MGRFPRFAKKVCPAEVIRQLGKVSDSADQFLAFQHEAAPAVAEVAEFLQKRRAALVDRSL